MKTNIGFLCVIVILLTFILACNLSGDILSASDTPTFAPPASDFFEGQEMSGSSQDGDLQLEKIVFSDQFSDSTGGWKTENFDEGSTDFYDEGFLITLNRSRYLLWSTVGKKYDNVRLDVDASWVGGGGDNSFGLICRYRAADHFYAFVITADGYYAIRKRTPETGFSVITGGYQYSEEILQSSQVNHLRADCNLDRLRLFVNGVLLAEVVDKDISSGNVGLIAGTFSSETTQIYFDNFVAEPLE